MLGVGGASPVDCLRDGASDERLERIEEAMEFGLGGGVGNTSKPRGEAKSRSSQTCVILTSRRRRRRGL
jgi:hypothetical protein